MPTATLTSKGQITIPLSVRQAAGLTAGDRIEFVCDVKGHYAIVPASYSIKSLKGIVPKPEKPVSVQDMEDAIVAGALA